MNQRSILSELSYSTDIRIWLSLEDYHNNGLTSQQTKEIIENIVSPIQRGGYSSFNKLRCEPSGLNGNWIVTNYANNYHEVEEVVRTIEYHLDNALDGIMEQHGNR